MTDPTPPDDLPDISDLAYPDTTVLDMRHPVTNQPLGWRITFGGPGHPQVLQAGRRQMQRRLDRERAQEQARVNNRRWKEGWAAPDTPPCCNAAPSAGGG